MKNLKVLGRRSVSLLLALAMCLSMTLSVFADSNLGIPESGVPAVEGSSVPADPASVPAAPENSNTDGLNTDNGEPLVIPETDPDNGDVDPTPVVEQHLVTVNHVYDEVDWYEFKHPAFELINKETNAKYDMIYEGNVATAKVPAGVYDVAYVDGGYFEIDLNVSGNVILELFSFVTGMFDGSMDNPPLVVKQYDKPRNSTGGQVKYSSTSGVVKEFLERAGKKKVLSWSVNGEEIVLDDYWMGTNTALVATCSEFEDYTVTVNHHYDEVDWHTFAPLELKLVDKATKAEYTMTADGKTYSVKVPEGKYALYLADRLLYEITELSADTKYDIYSFVVGMFAENTDSAPVIKKQYDGIIRPELIIYGNRGPQVVAFEETTGKKVSSWSVNGSVIDLGNTTINSNTALVAAFEEEVKPGNVHLVVYANGNTTKPVYQGTLDPQEYCEGTVIDLAELDINNYYSSRNGFESTGWMDDGRWNNYKNSGNARPLSELTVTGSWQNLQLMVTDYEVLSIKAVTNGDKDNAESLVNVLVLHGTELVPYLNANVTVAEKTGYTLDKWFNWDWYGHKLDDARKITGWTNAYVTYTANEYNVTLDAGDGVVTPASVTVTYDDVYGELPTPVHANANYKFVGWFMTTADGEVEVTAETVVATKSAHTLTAKWDLPRPAYPKDGTNIQDNLYTVQCTTNDAHHMTHSGFIYVNTSRPTNNDLAYNEELGRWEITVQISLERFVNTTVTMNNYFGGMKHYMPDGQSIASNRRPSIKLYWDPTAEGTTATGTPIVGMWKSVDASPVVINVMCLDKPAAPTISKLSGNMLWLRDCNNLRVYQKYTIKNLIADSYELGEMYKEGEDFYCELKVNVAPYVDDFIAKKGEGYVLCNMNGHTSEQDKEHTEISAASYTLKLKYTGSKTDYKQDGTGWTVEYPTTSIKNNGYQVFLSNSFVVTFDAGEGNTVDPATKKVTYNTAYGELPTPVHANANYKFDGWFMTTADGEVEVTAETVVATKADHTLNAHWSLITPRDATASEIELFAKTITFKCVDCGSTVTLAELANSDLISVGEPVFVNGEFHRTLTINIAACAAKSSEALKTEENRNCEHTLAVAEATRAYTADTYSADLIWNPVTLEWTYNGEDITVELTSAKMKYQWLDHKNEVLYTTEQAVCLVANAPAFVGSVPDYTADNGHNFTFTSFTDGVESKDEATGQIIVTYTAQYSCTTRNVEFKDNIITVAKIIVDKNTPVTPDMYPAPPTPPYRHVFRCWRLDSQDADGNLVFVAVWDYDYSYTCTITYKDGSGEDQVYSNVMMGSRTPEFDGIPIREGYRFAGWSPNVSAFVNQFDVVYTAIWVKDDNSSSLTVDEIEVNEPVEATDTPVETDEPSETIPEVTVPEDKETNPETGLALSLLPMAAAALIVVIKRK